MRRLLPFALIPLLFALAPAAEAATVTVVPSGSEGRPDGTCGVPSAHAAYETPEVQVFVSKRNMYACYRETGKQRVVGTFANDGMGTDEGHYIYGLLGGRWLHQGDYATFSESADYRSDQLLDLRTGKQVQAVVSSEDETNEVVALAGALVQASDKGVIARFTDGHKETLESAPAEALASSGARVYWRTSAGPRSALLNLPAPAAARPLPRAHRTAGCTPRTGAKLVLSDGLVVVTRVGDVTYGCRKGRTRKVGVVDDVRIVSDREVAYTRPGFTGVLNVESGKRRELDGAGPVGTNGWTLVAGGTNGLRVWPDDRTQAKLLAPGPVSDVAVSDGFVAGVVYWMDGAGNPRATT